MHPKIKVKQGTVIGGEDVLPNGKRYHFFKGIPYAVPPLGKLRFKATVPLERFQTEEILCIKEGNVSCQLDTFTRKMIGSEDCLFLNVFSPQTQKDTLLPVMVNIHGGAYVNGSGNSEFSNPLYLMQEDVVVVTFNYRLGVLGFLSLPEANIPGNAGIKDQRLALQWVHENISQFNGDPNNVTIFGESAGATCVNFHVLAEASKCYIHKAIMQSGMVTMSWAWDKSPKEKTLNLVKMVGCPSKDPFEILEFLQAYPKLEDFVKPFIPKWTIQTYITGRSIPSLPVMEKHSPESVLSPESVQSLREKNSIEIPLMVGYNSAEGILLLPCVTNNLGYWDQHLDTFIPDNIRGDLTDRQKAEVVEKMRDFYLHGQKLNQSNLQNFCELMGDYFFVISANHLAEIHSRRQHKTPLYFYRFDVDESLNFYKKKSKMEKIKGASHADDMFYIFQTKVCPEPWDKNAKNIVLKMSKLWANFAKYGNPTPKLEGDVIDCIWEPLRNSDDESRDLNLNALVIDRKLKMIENPDGERLEFWRKIRQQYVNV